MRNITIKNLFFSLSIIVCAFTASAVGRSTQPVDVDDADRSPLATGWLLTGRCL